MPPAAVINAAAYTAVDRAEQDVALAARVNADRARRNGPYAAARGTPLVQISTDYVFDGAAPRRAPDDAPAPLNAYGRTKLAGERAVARGGGRMHPAHVVGFLGAWAPTSCAPCCGWRETRDALTVVDDQVGGPTPAAAIATACLTVADRCENPDLAPVSTTLRRPRYELGRLCRAIFAGGARGDGHRHPTATGPTPGARPLNSRLDCNATQTAFGIARPDWRRAARPPGELGETRQ